MNRIQIVQGDSIDTVITLEGDGVEAVTGVDFVCPALNAKYYLEQTSDVGGWWLYIPREDTEKFRPGIFKYNLVATFTGGWKEAIIYDYECEVLFKN